MAILYRPDIDGLRAVAVLAVVLFHADVSGFSGGFTGVDVFFVISGYLITSIIMRELGASTFSLARFYERRFRRILPAFSVVALFSLVLGVVLLHPRDLRDLGTSMIAAAGFSSNVHFYLKADYFARPAEFQPLLHTWSLAVEEQFYIFFPLLLVVLARRRRPRFALWLAAIAVASFAVNLVTLIHDESAAFYLTHARAWELMLGSLVALQVLPRPASCALREVLTIAGLAAIAYSVTTFTKHTPFPGIAALAPTLGTAAIIYAGLGGTSLVTSALSLRPVVWIGLLSYSLYLWHWPLLVYAKIYTITGLTPAWTAGALLVSFAASYASWRWVEQPFRSRWRVPRGTVLKVGGGVLAALALVAAVPVIARGFPQRFPPQVLADLPPGQWKSCSQDLRRFNAKDGDALCRLGVEGEPIRFLVWGDSHALALAPGIDAAARSVTQAGLIANKSACPPLLGVDRMRRSPTCKNFNDQVLAYLRARPNINTVILAARWALSATGVRYGLESGRDVRLVDLEAKKNRDGKESNLDIYLRGLERTLAALRAAGKHIVVVGQIPEVGIDVPAAYAIAYATGRDVNALIAPARTDYDARVRDAHAPFVEGASRSELTFIEPHTALCDTWRCRVTREGYALYRDDDHLSFAGAAVVAPLFRAYMAAQR